MAAAGHAPAKATVAAANQRPVTAGEWARVLRALVPHARQPLLAVLIVPAAHPDPPSDTLLKAGRQLQADGLFAAVCALPERNWDCAPDQTRPYFRVNGARLGPGDTVRVELAFGWNVLESDTTMVAYIRRDVCITEDHVLRPAGVVWEVVRSETVVVC